MGDQELKLIGMNRGFTSPYFDKLHWKGQGAR